MLILDVRVAIDPKHDHALNEWYHTHVPRLVSLPGYTSGRRYVSLTDGPRYAALYEITDPSYLPSLLGADPAARHPLTLSEWAEWDERFVPHMTHGSTDLYEAAGAPSPLLVGDGPVVEFRFEGALRDGEPLPGIERSATWLRAANRAEVAWLHTRPANLLLVQPTDVDAAIALSRDEDVRAALRDRGAADIECVAYAQIARHWPYAKEHMP
ncbi:MAG: hypothetical protein QOF76_1568 [Solirubrobacteraceae bacterium]|nr:hypothetical protein [Solirubrobacteraceae bacterium]